MNWSGLEERKSSGEAFSDDRRQFVNLRASAKRCEASVTNRVTEAT